MTDIRQGRWTAEIDGDFVVFVIGARINSWRHALAALGDLGRDRPASPRLVLTRSSVRAA